MLKFERIDIINLIKIIQFIECKKQLYTVGQKKNE